jgi:hypothetical protein
MLSPLKSLIKEKTLARISFVNGTSIDGFVTYADEEIFEVYIPDNVYNQLAEETEDGIYLENEEDIDCIDFKFVKGIFITQTIFSIITDTIHKYPVEKISYIDKIKHSIYKNNMSGRIFKVKKKEQSME